MAHKVLMLLFTPLDSDPRVEKEGRALAKAGFEVTVFAWNRTGTYPGTTELDGIRIVRIGPPLEGDFEDRHPFLQGLLKMVAMIRYWRRACLAARSTRWEVVHAHDLDTLPAAVSISRRSNCPLVFDSHEWYPGLMQTRLGYLAGLGAEAGQRILTPSVESVLVPNRVIARNFPDNQIHIIRNVVDLDWMDADTGEAHDFGDLPVVVYVGGVTQGRGLSTLLKAADLVKSEVQILVVGDGPLLPTLKRQGANLKTPVRFAGRVQRRHIPSMLRACRVGVIPHELVPNYSEGTPTKLFEYMAARLPVVATRTPGLEEIVREVNCGVLVDPGNPVSMASGLDELLGTPGKAQQMGEAGRSAVETRYQWSIEAETLVALYRRLSDGNL